MPDNRKHPRVVVDSSDSVVENGFGLSMGDGGSEEVNRLDVSEEEARRVLENYSIYNRITNPYTLEATS